MVVRRAVSSSRGGRRLLRQRQLDHAEAAVAHSLLRARRLARPAHLRLHGAQPRARQVVQRLPALGLGGGARGKGRRGGAVRPGGRRDAVR